jgi:hypothetical protein
MTERHINHQSPHLPRLDRKAVLPPGTLDAEAKGGSGGAHEQRGAGGRLRGRLERPEYQRPARRAVTDAAVRDHLTGHRDKTCLQLNGN